MTDMNAVREFGSFRDPSGSVLYLDGQVFRGVDADTFQRIRTLSSAGVLQELTRDKMLVATEIVEPDSPLGLRLADAFAPSAFFLSHETIPFVSYPYEWTPAMLADAGLLHLDLQLRLLKKGYSLKDASAFNVAFVGTRPVFMDVPSIEVPKRKDVWTAYGQFCRMFIYPLLLNHYCGMDFRQCFLGNLSGPSVAETRRALGLFGALRPAAFVDVFLQNLLCSTAEKQISKPGGAVFTTPRQSDCRAQELNLMRLRSKLSKWSMPRAQSISAWSEYEKTKSYADADEIEKTGFIMEFFRDYHPSSVLDIGCNTGRYSMMAVNSGSQVIAADSDSDSIDLLYQSVRGLGLDLLPLCVDITNPGPALGFRHRERKSFEARAGFDGVLALALIHHLLVAARIPLPALCDLFAALTREWLIVEFVHPQDSMFQRLLATRENLYADLTVEQFETEFGRLFEIIRKRAIMGGNRVLYLMRRK